MKILLVTRGAQGNIYPYLTIASELKRRGHEVVLSLPSVFGRLAKSLEIDYILQDTENIEHMTEYTVKSRNRITYFLNWGKNTIDNQFNQLIPILEQSDLLIASNTEFAAASIAEYCGKPLIRTAFAPFIPGKHIPPPAFPLPKPNPVFTPAFLWKCLNRITNLIVKRTINRNRKKLEMAPIRNFGKHTLAHSKNYLLYSRYLGSVDTEWKAEWKIGGYCFTDHLQYERNDQKEILNFIRRDDRPTLFFTLGSCSNKQRNQLCEWILHTCKKEGYKLIVESGWSKTGTYLQESDTLFLLHKPLPHHLILPHCAAVIHHGGCGITHSAVRAGIPQWTVPIILDQYYWGYQVFQLGLGPESVPISQISQQKIHDKIVTLLENKEYKTTVQNLSVKVKAENGLHNFYKYIEKQGEINEEEKG